MKLRHTIVWLALVFLAACTPGGRVGSPAGGIPGEGAALPLNLPDPAAVARAYLDGWKSEDYQDMYTRLTTVSQAALSQAEFVDLYQSVAAEAVLTGVDYEIRQVFTTQESAQVSYRVSLNSLLVGALQRDTIMNLSLERNQWRVQWDDTLILPELKDGNYLHMERQSYRPARGNIYDRSGHALVAQADATAVGLYPDDLDPQQADTLFAALQDLTGLRREAIESQYARFPKGAGWYLPLGEVSAEQVAQQYSLLSGLQGLALSPYKSRYYFDGGVAPHVVGYVSAIQPEEAEAYQRKGYQADERIGRDGLEKWGETALAGRRGGALYVYSPQGKPVTLLAQSEPEAAQAIYTTLDRDFQIGSQQALSGFPGAAVVLERDTGRVLALVSSPSFDPNAFENINFNSSALMEAILQDPANPLLNRASQGLYPLGSVYKTITMAAGLESGRFSPDSLYYCGYAFTELAGATLYDWTYDYNQSDHRTQPSGMLTLSQGLMRSCNPWFWHIGLDLYTAGLTKNVAEMARGFGLGSSTGVVGIEDAAGNIPDPANEVDAVNGAIGQGDVLVTPLQVADFIAAIGNGGTLYRPQVVEKVVSPGGELVYAFKPEARGQLPVKAETLQAIQKAMTGVIRSTKPFGTAWYQFTGLDIKVAGKTGTATSGPGAPHAWFAGYTFEGREDRPDIAAVVIIENGGEGSVVAAPIFRRLVELYFTGQPQKLYQWESGYNIPATPTPVP